MMAGKGAWTTAGVRYRNTYWPGTTMTSAHQDVILPQAHRNDATQVPGRCAGPKRITPEKKRGVGLIRHVRQLVSCNDFCEVTLELNPDDTVTLYCGWHDMGQGADAGALVLIHEALRPLGLNPGQIRLVLNDTALHGYYGAAAGSRSHYMGGKAMIDGANQLMDAMRTPAGPYRTDAEMPHEDIPVRYTGKASTVGYSTPCDFNTMQGDPTQPTPTACSWPRSRSTPEPARPRWSNDATRRLRAHR
jgi:aldehyde oxidoreductase